jgi:hypothetical protein
MTPSPLTSHYKRALIQRVKDEARLRKPFTLPVHLDLHPLICVVAHLQLALRHPANKGLSSEVVRRIVDMMIERVEAAGFPATAEMLRLGDDPEFDE